MCKNCLIYPSPPKSKQNKKEPQLLYPDPHHWYFFNFDKHWKPQSRQSAYSALCSCGGWGGGDFVLHGVTVNDGYLATLNNCWLFEGLYLPLTLCCLCCSWWTLISQVFVGGTKVWGRLWGPERIPWWRWNHARDKSDQNNPAVCSCSLSFLWVSKYLMVSMQPLWGFHFLVDCIGQG